MSSIWSWSGQCVGSWPARCMVYTVWHAPQLQNLGQFGLWPRYGLDVFCVVTIGVLLLNGMHALQIIRGEVPHDTAALPPLSEYLQVRELHIGGRFGLVF